MSKVDVDSVVFDLVNGDTSFTVSDLHFLGVNTPVLPPRNPGCPHSWENHVSEQFRAIWSQLSDETRGAIRLVAEEAARDEEWD
jgi:hypothetical protein